MKGYELIKKIENNELRESTKIKFTSTIAPEEKIVIIIKKDEGLYLKDIETGNIINTGWLINSNIEIIEEQEDIDIQSIEEIKEVFIENASCGEDVKFLARKYNEIAQAIKQLEKKIKEK